ncbi:MAG: hypothetical protein WAN36_08875, partial [Calditrichia bacterium]
ADNWGAAVDASGSTPGRQNSIFISQKENRALLSVTPNPFSPDGDGYEDFALIEYKLPFATGYLSAEVYDMAGRSVRLLADNQPAGQKGHLIWDGRDNQGRICRIGIYIMLFKLREPGSGYYKEVKKTVVLAHQ